MIRMMLVVGLLGLAGCTASLSAPALESKLETVSGAPTAICTSLITQQAQSLAQLKAMLNAP